MPVCHPQLIIDYYEYFKIIIIIYDEKLPGGERGRHPQRPARPYRAPLRKVNNPTLNFQSGFLCLGTTFVSRAGHTTVVPELLTSSKTLLLHLGPPSLLPIPTGGSIPTNLRRPLSYSCFTFLNSKKTFHDRESLQAFVMFRHRQQEAAPSPPPPSTMPSPLPPSWQRFHSSELRANSCFL